MKLISILTAVIFIINFPRIAHAQKIEDIYFHLYTDSLKMGVYNYINVDGKLANGRFIPLSADEINFSCNTGKWDGNNLIIDSSYKKDSVVVTAVLIKEPAIEKKITIFMKKNLFGEKLKTENEILRELNKRKTRN